MAGERDGQERRPGLTYRDAGVDIDAQDEALRRVKQMVHSTRTAGVLADLGSFGGLFRPERLKEMEDPILVSSCDGIGTKLRIAFMTGIHHTVGRDLVNHCVNDILVQGARPLFFMDYLATGRLDPGVIASIVEGLTDGCRKASCALLGGETAEMPGFYGDGEYDVAGFIVGIVDRPRLIDGSGIREGDVVLGLAGKGLHTNGYSLARKVFLELAGLGVDDRVDELDATVGEVLLAEHPSYLTELAPPVEQGAIAGMAHITGGGLTDNLPRILPEGTAAVIRRGSWPVTPVFEYIRREGNVAEDEMYRTFNMGIGMAVVVHPDHVRFVQATVEQLGTPVFRIGEIVAGDGRVRYA